jgi:hypothetical protein
MRMIAGSLLALTVVFLPAAVFGRSEEQKPVQIVLYPSPEPRPALKYQLLPPFMERRPGNAAVFWNRVPAERSHFYADLYATGGLWDKLQKWMDIPLGDPREKAYRTKELAKDIGILHPGGICRDMERAARFESCDWQLPFREGNPFEVLLPEMQQTRTYARLLSAKAHLEIAEGKYDEAVRTLQTGYAEARHVAQAPCLVCSLIGVTIAGVMSHQVQQFIQQPDAPNLYWALSTLPRPLIDFRPAGELESNFLYLQFPELRDLDKKRLSPEESRALLDKVLKDLSRIYGQSAPKAHLAETAESILQGHPRAKRWLIEHGRAAAEVEAMPAAQVVLLYSVRLYEQFNDDHFKWFFLPASEAGNGPEQADRHLTKANLAKCEIIPLASVLLPAVMAAKGAETRLQWTLAMLRVFEAMRLYAAAHDGRWPERLSDITHVPIPINPCDGKPFVYQRQGDKAVLTSERGPKGMPWRYEITLKAKAK